jgi:hypothetical protein
MITTLSKGPNDNFTYDLFQNLLSTVTVEFEAYYMWTAHLEEFKKFVEKTVFVKPTVIIGFKDLLDLCLEFDYWTETVSAGTKLLANMAQRNKDKNFIIFTSMENLKIELDRLGVTNIQLVEWGGDITNQSALYPSISPVFNKNLNSTKTFISLTRHPRAHRVVLLSYLFGTGYDDHGYITYIGQDRFDLPDSILNNISWQFDQQHARVRPYIINGYKKFYNNKKLQIIGYDGIYSTVNANVDNFVNRLALLYKNSFVEIVTESSFSAPSFMITEKTLNSVYGCNFPIILSGVGAVDHLRSIGFDMFDDIIDHSYDRIANPFDRILAAIENNRKLLVDSGYVKEQWKSNQYRFENNISIAQTNLYEWYSQRAVVQFNKIKWAQSY